MKRPCMRNSTLAQDVVLAERLAMTTSKSRLDMLRVVAETYVKRAGEHFAVGHLKPWGYNSLEDITFL